MIRKELALEVVDLEANRTQRQRLASGTESRSSSKEHCRSWRSAWRYSAAAAYVAAATASTAARVDQHLRRTTAAHRQGFRLRPVGALRGRTHRAKRRQLRITHMGILFRGHTGRATGHR